MDKNLYKLSREGKSNSESIKKKNEKNFKKVLNSDSAKSGIKK